MNLSDNSYGIVEWGARSANTIRGSAFFRKSIFRWHDFFDFLFIRAIVEQLGYYTWGFRSAFVYNRDN